MIAVSCPCGKQVIGSEAMAGEEAQCFKCGRMLRFPAPRVRQTVGVGVDRNALLQGLGGVDDPPPAPAQAPPAGATEAVPTPPVVKRSADSFYWALLIALAPLVLVLIHPEEKVSVLKRLERTLASRPDLKPIVEQLLRSEETSLDDLFKILPDQRIDKQAFLPRFTTRHWEFAVWAGCAFFVLVAVLMGWGVVPPWYLLLVAAFTATFGVAALFVFHDYVGPGYQLTLSSDQTLFVNILGFTLVVGLGEELAKALPVIFYVRTHRTATWRGACLWGLASGVGFGIAEGVMYSVRSYNGVAGADIYLVRFASCVALHGVWSASVGITVFQSRQLLSKILGAILYGGDWKYEDLAWPIARILGVAMLLHGMYDSFLTQDLVPVALFVALLSFGYLSWQIETCRDQEAQQAAEAQPLPATA